MPAPPALPPSAVTRPPDILISASRTEVAAADTRGLLAAGGLDRGVAGYLNVGGVCAAEGRSAVAAADTRSKSAAVGRHIGVFAYAYPLRVAVIAAADSRT